jgi:hypothetical protein
MSFPEYPNLKYSRMLALCMSRADADWNHECPDHDGVGNILTKQSIDIVYE